MGDSSSETIVALSSGSLPSGVAVLRLSGASVREVLSVLVGSIPEPRVMTLRAIRDLDGQVIDRGLIAFFPGPYSFTGEDCAEFQVHGSRAVVADLLALICSFADVRLADAGEFTRQAFENGRLDLTSVEGLGDLLAAQTSSQRQLALARSEGSVATLIAGWRGELAQMRAEVEAQLDFSDEEDVPEAVSAGFQVRLDALKHSLLTALKASRSGEIVRDGFKVVLAGAPNAGKSSLLNALAGRDVAIVTDEAGTTRDVLEVTLNLSGQLVRLFDVAGLRVAQGIVEAEGVRRANLAIDDADLVIWLAAPDVGLDMSRIDETAVVVSTKSDLQATTEAGVLRVSSVSGEGLDALIALISARASAFVGEEPGLLSRARDRVCTQEALDVLSGAGLDNSLELLAESLRLASSSLERLIGVVDSEAVLDVLFSGFCIGK